MKEMFHDNGSRARERATELIVILERGPELSDYLKSRLRVSGRSGKLSRKKIGQTRPVADVEQPEKKIKVEMELKKKRMERWSIWCIAVGFYGSFGTFHILFLIFPL
jgi:hypothetical protein